MTEVLFFNKASFFGIYLYNKYAEMKYNSFLLFVFLSFGFPALYAQETLQPAPAESKYLEDQFYAGITYNLLLEMPEEVSQNNFSNGFHLGFIKDIPVNTRRNTGFGIGLGYALNSYYSNLRAFEAGDAIHYEVIAPEITYKRNKIENHIVEMPVEFRWRTSTKDIYKFWRIYTGVKLGYVFANVSKYIEDAQKDKFSNPDIRKFQYGVYISFGYNTWNFYANYQLSPLLEKDVVTTTGEAIQMRALRIGLNFYIL